MTPTRRAWFLIGFFTCIATMALIHILMTPTPWWW